MCIHKHKELLNMDHQEGIVVISLQRKEKEEVWGGKERLAQGIPVCRLGEAGISKLMDSVPCGSASNTVSDADTVALQARS